VPKGLDLAPILPKNDKKKTFSYSYNPRKHNRLPRKGARFEESESKSDSWKKVRKEWELERNLVEGKGAKSLQLIYVGEISNKENRAWTEKAITVGCAGMGERGTKRVPWEGR